MIQDILNEQENISYKEEKVLKFVLSKYKFEVININKYRNLYKVECKEGIFYLKRIQHGKRQIINMDFLIQNLNKVQFNNIGVLVRTKEGNLYVRTHKYIFYVTDYIEGKKCDLDILQEAVNCSSLLAKFHLSVNSIDTRDLKIKNKIKDRPKIFYDKLLNMEKFKQIIEKKRIKNEFDLAYLNSVDNFYNIGAMTLNILNNSKYYTLVKEAARKRTITSETFYNRIVINQDGEYIITELNDIAVDIQIMDLAKFIRRLMYKENYKWNFDKAKCIIYGYSKIRPLTKDELELILSVITFPHKFWKLGNKRYIKQRGWSEPKYMHKIEKLIENFTLQKKFFMDFIDYINQFNINEE